MFNENFSFLSATSSTTSTPYEDCTSSEVSPLTSRSSSPRPYHPQHNYLDSQRSHYIPPRRDSRFNSITSIPRNPSVTALTAQLETHALSSSDSAHLVASPTTIIASTPPSSSFSDEGFVDGPVPSPSTSASDYDTDYDPSLWDLSTSIDLNITSSPRDPLNLPSFALRRRQRQALVRLQCLAQRAPDLMMLIEECHPSSMPLPEEPIWVANRQHSTPTASLPSSARVEKEKTSMVAVKRSPRMRKRSTR